MSLAGMLILGWCSSSSDVSILDCVWQSDSTACVVDNVNNIKDEFTKNCIQNNIMSKTWMVQAIEWGKDLLASDIKDIDNVARSCIGYKAENNGNVSSTNIPVFNSFLTSMAGSFAGMYLYNSFLWGSRYNYNSPIDSNTYNNYRRQCSNNTNGNCSSSSRWGWYVARPFVWGANSIWTSYAKSSVSSSKGTLWGSARSWSSVSSHGSSLG